jgi:hypothetical protein
MKMAAFWDIAPLVWYKMADVSEVLVAIVIRSIALKMEAVRTSETSVNFYETIRRNIPEGSHLHVSVKFAIAGW